MNLSEDIYRRILELMENSAQNIAEIQRNELAGIVGCVPSQINYVISSRFTPEHGYIVESRRGGGGYIKIFRIKVDKRTAIMHLINSIGVTLDAKTLRIVLENLLEKEIIDVKMCILINAAASDKSLISLPVEYRDKLRAVILKQMLLVLYN